MAHRAAAPTRVTVTRLERAQKPPPGDWRPRSLLEPLFKRDPFDLFAALTAHLVAPDPDEQASEASRLHTRTATTPPPPGTVGTPADVARDFDDDDGPRLARIALPAGFSFGPEGSAGTAPAGWPWAFAAVA